MGVVTAFSGRLTMDNMPTEEQTYRANVQEKLDTILTQVKYTNGKVRKIIIAVFLIGGVLIGELFSPREIVAAIATHFL